MKFNYFKTAKEKGHTDEAYGFAHFQKYDRGNRRYMAALWLAWSYTFLRNGDKLYLHHNLKSFLEEIEAICDK